jgi:crotonobetainyl-CoA:carnitine CoA-transferase CaiB-like acyl-CoA transferase
MLDGVTVLGVDIYLAGPFATRMLRDLGAEVIKVENIDRGDTYRYLKHDYDDGMPEDLTHRFLQYNQGKRSLALNLKEDRGQEIFRELAEDADVILENLKPGSMEKFGLGYKDIHEINEEIVYCSISGYGATGPYKDRSAVDTIIQAMSGLVSQNAADADSPALTGIYIADMVGSMYATISILSALASETHNGTYIDISMLDGLVSLLNHEAAEYSATGTAGPQIRSSLVPQGVYETNDGAIALNVLDQYWPVFCDILGIDDWAASTKFNDPMVRQANKDHIEERIEGILRTESTEYWINHLLEQNIMAAPVKTLDEAFEDEAITYRELVRERDDEAIGEYIELDFPAKFSNYETRTKNVPRFGEDTKDVLEELDYSREEIRAMFEDRIVTDYEH